MLQFSRTALPCLLLCVIACSKPLPDIKAIDLAAWRNDQRGCHGIRQQSIDTLRNQKHELLGLSEMEIVAVLGKPDEQELYARNQKFYRYILEPGTGCPTPHNNALKLIILFNAVGLAKEISFE